MDGTAAPTAAGRRPVPAGRRLIVAVLLSAAVVGCRQTGSPPRRSTTRSDRPVARAPVPKPAPPQRRDFKVVHVFVALCDNRHQGIVRVSDALGNGQDPKGNLYWGAMYGVRTFFKRSPEWTEQVAYGPRREPVLARASFLHRSDKGDVHVVADAYDGAKMKEALTDFFRAAAGVRGLNQASFDRNGRKVFLPTAGAADIVCFVGHNGLMDVRLPQIPAPTHPRPMRAVVLACKSRDYFVAPLRKAGCKPLITTTGLMAPEAYTLDAIIRSWAAGETPAQTRDAAAAAYAKYQKCSLAAARRLFAAGE